MRKTCATAGAIRLEWTDAEHDHDQLHAELQRFIYHGQTIGDLAKPATWAALGVFGLGLLITVPRDRARRRARQQGQTLRGPKFPTVRQFNRITSADGLEIRQGKGVRTRW